MVAQQKLVSIAILFATLIGTGTPVPAATSVGRFGASVTITDSCQINTPEGTESAFGPGDTLSDPAQETTVECGLDTPFQIGTEATSSQQAGISYSGQQPETTILTITY